MNTLFTHIDRIRAKPHHIRKQVAYGTAAAGTAFIALVWLVGNVALGSFTLTVAPAGEAPAVVTTDMSGTLAGASAALPPGVVAAPPAHIEIVDTHVATSSKKRSEQTTIPF